MGKFMFGYVCALLGMSVTSTVSLINTNTDEIVYPLMISIACVVMLIIDAIIGEKE